MPFVNPVSMQTGFYITLLSAEGSNAPPFYIGQGEGSLRRVRARALELALCSDPAFWLSGEQEHFGI